MIGKVILLWLSGLMLGVMLLDRVLTVQADTDLNVALSKAPQGITLAKYFEAGTAENNHAQVVDATNAQTAATQVVKLTDNSHQMGSIWSTENNPFDLDHEQVISMWLYFGNRGSDATDEENQHNNTAGDGMAFVLQNDPRGIQAVTSMPAWVHQGENLGTWGFDRGYNYEHDNLLSDKKVLETVASSAIQRSWALEFDTHLNTSHLFEDLKGWGDSFDRIGGSGSIRFPHIAANYPGEPDSYKRSWSYSSKTSGEKRSYISLEHSGLIVGENFNFLSDGNWHHLTIRYRPEHNGNKRLGDLTYGFNDRNAVTGVPQRGTVRHVILDKRRLTDADHPHTTRWGFTGATGANYENNLVVFDQIPDLVDVSAQAELVNLSQQKVVHEGDTVRERDQVKLTYTVDYRDGKADWHEVIANLKLPQHIQYQSGTIAYGGGAQASETLTRQELTTTRLVKKLNQTFSKSYNQVKISLIGKVAAGNAQVPATTSSFNGTEAVAEATAPGFQVEALKFLTLHLTNPLTQMIERDGQVNIAGQVAVLENEDTTNDDLMVHAAVNGREVRTRTLDVQRPLGVVNEQLEAQLFTADASELTVWVTDTRQHMSNKVAIMVYRGHLLLKSVTDQVKFKGQLRGHLQRLPAQRPIRLTVDDTRRNGAGWHVTAMATPMVRADQRPLIGQLVYAKGRETKYLMPDEAQTLVSHKSGWVRTSNYSATINDLFLQVGASAIAGDYAGSITWTLHDAP
ncbi:L-type lectin family protein [Levilactobacillus tujiorum]|uniref:lectin-like domain-containing protein n=1 Tax=Levilactobacillus tujiorum TaxID=2912243 RepID=UPI0014567899|nr:hypothetical protein [Levilactobacillus tujiorum]